MKKRLFSIAAILLPVFIAGCIGTGTIIIVQELDEFVSTGNSLEVIKVDLTTNQDYNDNKDKIKSVDQVTVTGWIFNLGVDSNQATIYISYDSTLSTPAEVESQATRVFTSPAVGPNDSLFIDWSDGLSHVENLSALKDAADTGLFWVYGIAENTPFAMRYRLTLVITLTAGL